MKVLKLETFRSLQKILTRPHFPNLRKFLTTFTRVDKSFWQFNNRNEESDSVKHGDGARRP